MKRKKEKTDKPEFNYSVKDGEDVMVNTNTFNEAIIRANEYIGNMVRSAKEIGNPMTEEEICDLEQNVKIVDNSNGREYVVDSLAF